MTRNEYLDFINPDHQHHDEDAYDFSLRSMNETLTSKTFVDERGIRFVYFVPYGGGQGLAIERNRNMIAIVDGPTAYVAHSFTLQEIPRPWPREPQIDGQLDAVQRTVAVKYPSDYVVKISDIVKRNREEYDQLVQRLTLHGEPFELRSRGPVQRGRGTRLAILNQRGEVVANAENEYGATLVVVAREYRKRGLGPLIHKYWQEFNPKFMSGGVTPRGKLLVLQRWEERVREFLERGWYSSLVREGRLPLARARSILQGLTGHRAQSTLPTAPAPKAPRQSQVLVYVDDPTFVVYDARFLQDQNEDFIHGYGFFRDHDPVGTFLFRIEYEPEYRKLVTSVALQMARDAGDRVYVGPGYGDMVEPQGIPGVTQDGNYLTLDHDLLDLRALGRKERAARALVDEYDQIHDLLLEEAESKWN